MNAMQCLIAKGAMEDSLAFPAMGPAPMAATAGEPHAMVVAQPQGVGMAATAVALVTAPSARACATPSACAGGAKRQ